MQLSGVHVQWPNHRVKGQTTDQAQLFPFLFLDLQFYILGVPPVMHDACRCG